MELAQNIIPDNYLTAIGWMIVHSIWQIAGIGLILGLALRVYQQKSANFKYLLSLSALICILFASTATFFYHFEAQVAGVTVNTLTATELNHFLNSDLPYIEEKESDSFFTAKFIEEYIPTLVNLWFFGALLYLIRLGSSLADIRNLNRKTHLVIGEIWNHKLAQFSKAMGINRNVKLMESQHVDVPITYGIWKPVILIPSAMLLNLHPSQLEAILVHELAHIKRHDYLINLFQSVMEICFFFHPVFWWINKTIKEQRENACDDLVIENGIKREALAYGLANVLNYAQNNPPEVAMAAVKKQNPTLDRIKRIMGVNSSPSQPTTLTSIIMIFTLLLGATLLVNADKNQPLDLVVPNESSLVLSENGNFDEFGLRLEIQRILDEQFAVGPELNNYNLILSDTVPSKKSRVIIIDGDSTKYKDFSDEDWKMHNELMEKMGQEMGNMTMIFKDLEFESGNFSNMPQINLGKVPMMEFNFDSLPKFDFDQKQFKGMFVDSIMIHAMPPMPPAFFKLDSTSSRNIYIHTTPRDTTNMSKEELQAWKEMQKVKVMKLHSADSAEIAKWRNDQQKNVEIIVQKQRELAKAYEPKIEAYKEQIKTWHEANEPKIREYEAQIKAWHEENQPKIEEFKLKMQEWQEANQEQLSEFQTQMKAMQIELQAQMQELEKVIKESVKEKD